MHLTEDELVLHYYGEMNEAAEERACAHLGECAACRQQLARLQRVMSALDTTPDPEPDTWFEQRMWARIEPALRTPELRRFALPWRTIAFGAAAALVVIAAFVAGQFSSRPSSPATTAATTALGKRLLIVDLGEHLDRSEAALVEFVSGTDGHDVSAGRQRVQDLVAANRLYRQTALSSGDAAVADVLDELERALIEIAAAPQTASTDDLDVLRRRMDTRGLLFKVRVMREQLQDRARGAQPVRAERTTI